MTPIDIIAKYSANIEHKHKIAWANRLIAALAKEGFVIEKPPSPHVLSPHTMPSAYYSLSGPSPTAPPPPGSSPQPLPQE